MTLQERIEKIASKNGSKEVINLVIEECSELTKELTKVNRGIGNIDNIIEEIADVYLTISQLKHLFGIDNYYIEKEMTKKVERTEERLEM